MWSGKRMTLSQLSMIVSQPLTRTLSWVRHKACLHQRQEQHVQEACDDVRSVFRQLRSQGLPLGKSRVIQHLSYPGMLRHPKVREVYLQLREEQESAGNVPLDTLLTFEA
jgi:hypothetical protein